MLENQSSAALGETRSSSPQHGPTPFAHFRSPKHVQSPMQTHRKAGTLVSCITGEVFPVNRECLAINQEYLAIDQER